MLTDNHGRLISYLRLSVTDRCNLRCFYCMPKHGLDWLTRSELMNNEEMLRICSLLVDMGISKIRITGGEPFARKDLMNLLNGLSLLKRKGLDELTITTNGVLSAPYVGELKDLGIRSVNLSLDTLDPARFFAITRRDEFSNVMKTMDALLKHNISVKINTVVMAGRNTQDIIPIASLTKDLPITVRFIEEMPFNGDGHAYSGAAWNYIRILDEVKRHFNSVDKLPDEHYSTAYNFQINGHKGTLGFIAAYSRTFCGTCNRIRLTPQGTLMTCLYGKGEINIKDAMRKGSNDSHLRDLFLNAFSHRVKDGWEAEKQQTDEPHESMASIGG